MKWIQRQKYFLDFTLSSLLRRKGKHLSLLVVYALIVFLIGSVMLFAGAIRKTAVDVLTDGPEMTVQRIIAGRHDFIPLHYIESIQNIRGVRTVRPRLWGYHFHPTSGANYTLMAAPGFEYGPDQVVVGAGVARSWSGIAEDRLYLVGFDGRAHLLKIVETLDSGIDLAAADLILMAASTFRDITGVPDGYATDLAVEIRNPRECATIAEKVVRLFPETRPILKSEILRTYAAVFDWRSGYVVVLLAGSVLAFFIFAWDRAVGLSAEERGEIGVLRAVGWDVSDILILKWWEGGVISLTAFFLGMIGAYLHVFLASAPLFAHALKGWAVLYPELHLYPDPNPYEIGALFFLTVVPFGFVTLIPAWKAAVTDPVSVMR
ncbi:MAG: ABC transporter permease [Thermodesulfobacteriota bacterium]